MSWQRGADGAAVFTIDGAKIPAGRQLPRLRGRALDIFRRMVDILTVKDNRWGREALARSEVHRESLEEALRLASAHRHPAIDARLRTLVEVEARWTSAGELHAQIRPGKGMRALPTAETPDLGRALLVAHHLGMMRDLEGLTLALGETSFHGGTHDVTSWCSMDGIKDLFQLLGPLPGIRRLELIGPRGRSFEELPALFPNLRELALDNRELSYVEAYHVWTPVADLRPIARLEKLEELHVSYFEGIHIPFEPGSRIRKLSLHGRVRRIDDENGNRRQKPDLSHAAVDLGTLASCTQLERLHLSWDGVLDLSPLSTHPSLHTIRFTGHLWPRQDLSPLARMPALCRLETVEAYEIELVELPDHVEHEHDFRFRRE